MAENIAIAFVITIILFMIYMLIRVELTMVRYWQASEMIFNYLDDEELQDSMTFYDFSKLTNYLYDNAIINYNDYLFDFLYFGTAIKPEYRHILLEEGECVER